jgi:hypothetical protein
MTQTEALRLALEALETLMIERGSIYDIAITAVQRALAQDALDRKAENARELGLDYEPVEWKMGASGIGGMGVIVQPQRTEQEQQIETLKLCLFQMQEAAKDLVEQAKSLTPPQRTWVGLTDEHKEGLIYMTDPNPEPHHLRELIDVVEFQLKEKNT